MPDEAKDVAVTLNTYQLGVTLQHLSMVLVDMAEADRKDARSQWEQKHLEAAFTKLEAAYFSIRTPPPPPKIIT